MTNQHYMHVYIYTFMDWFQSHGIGLFSILLLLLLLLQQLKTMLQSVDAWRQVATTFLQQWFMHAATRRCCCWQTLQLLQRVHSTLPKQHIACKNVLTSKIFPQLEFSMHAGFDNRVQFRSILLVTQRNSLQFSFAALPWTVELISVCRGRSEKRTLTSKNYQFTFCKLKMSFKCSSVSTTRDICTEWNLSLTLNRTNIVALSVSTGRHCAGSSSVTDRKLTSWL